MINQNVIRVSRIKSSIIKGKRPLKSHLKKGDIGGCVFSELSHNPLTPFSKGDILYPKTGFTLIEVLVSIFVLAIGVFGVMALFPVGIHQTGKIARNTIGAISAEIPLAYTSYKYPAGNLSGTDYDIRNIVSFLSGTTTPACYFYPDTGTLTISGNASFGWNMSLVPIDIDSNGTATSIGETYLFRQQIAIYKNYATNSGTANFAYNSQTMSNVSNINNISVNDYICNTQNHIWYRVTGVDTSTGNVTLQQSYEYETKTAAPYISTDTIVGLYNTTLTPD
ncbi:MAG: prepilin-type N-terminal cleavage/methylation domain-containing protein [Planctomycetes bacterium]|nr:prepilin-type N-terminal cleavage/methylation domain-containing protein [Planctomycetota bacterium]